MNNTDRDALREPWRVSRCSTWSRRATRTATSKRATSSRAAPLKLVGVPEGQRPTDAQFVQQLMLSLLGMACFNSERMLEWAAEAFDWFAAVLMPNPVRDCCLIRTNIVCIRVGPYCISICTRHVNALYLYTTLVHKYVVLGGFG